MTRHKIAAVQMTSGPDVSTNLSEADRLIGAAKAGHADIVVLPENFAFMGERESDKIHIREPYGSGPIQTFLSEQARKRNLWLVGGTIPLEASVHDKVRAACMLFDDQGRAVARYDKMHLFDVMVVGEEEERYTESDTIEPGSEVVVADTPLGRLGLAVCYDLRFPELFRAMLPGGMDLIALPSAFTAATGRAHWETLLRARAIENLCYVVAAGQGGVHAGGRETYGHSMVIDPWGTVLQTAPTGSGVVIQDFNGELLATLRRNFPAIEHIRHHV